MVEILTFKELLAQPEPPWLIEGIVRTDQVAVVYGPPNEGKTFLVLDWAMHVAANLPWVGRAVTQGPVLYMAGEGAFSLQKRGQAWADFWHQEDVPIYFQARPLDLRSDEVLTDLHAALDDYSHPESAESQLNPSLIIVDTLSQFFGGGDENGADMAQFVQACRSLSQSRETAVLIVHHTNATGLRERGNTALRGNTDVMFEVKGVEEHGKLVGLTVRNDKQRDDPKATGLSLRIIPVRDSLVISGLLSDRKSPHVRHVSDEKLQDLLKCALTVEDKEREIISLPDWRMTSPLQERSFYRYLGKALDQKLIRTAGRGFYRFTQDGKETVHALLSSEGLAVGNSPQLTTRGPEAPGGSGSER